MSQGFVFEETDHGSKKRAKRGIVKARKYNRRFKDYITRYWWKVWQDARNNLIIMNAYDTGTLYNTVRISFGTGGVDVSGISGAGIVGGPTFEITAGPDRIEVTGMIRAGGMLINPKTGQICNYAESVHDGTGKNVKKGPRPFLTDAIAQNEGYLQSILGKFADRLCKKFCED